MRTRNGSGETDVGRDKHGETVSSVWSRHHSPRGEIYVFPHSLFGAQVDRHDLCPRRYSLVALERHIDINLRSQFMLHGQLLNQGPGEVVLITARHQSRPV